MGGMEIKLAYVVDLPDLSTSFHKVSLDKQATDFDIDVMKHSDFFTYILLLPKMDHSWNRSEYTENLYYIIDSNWCEIEMKMQWRYPRSHKCKY